MKRYVTCHVIETAPLSAASMQQPIAAACNPVRIYRPASHSLRTPQPRTQQNLSASGFGSLVSRIYTHHPFPPGELVNIAV